MKQKRGTVPGLFFTFPIPTPAAYALVWATEREKKKTQKR